MAVDAERTEWLFVQMQLELEDIKADAAENERATEVAATKMTIVVSAPCSRPAYSGGLSKLGEGVATISCSPDPKALVPGR